ncbi:MAG: hypothetical protein J6U39_00285, partial [Clostridia bacterium]|nr:hypothetical protein [Clostridia bacterium]
MSETNKDALANIAALFELDKAKFRSLTVGVRDARRRAEDLLAKITAMKDEFVASELAKEEAAELEREAALAEETLVKEESSDVQDNLEAPVAQTEAEEPAPEIVPEDAVAQQTTEEVKAPEAPAPEAPAEPKRN